GKGRHLGVDASRRLAEGRGSRGTRLAAREEAGRGAAGLVRQPVRRGELLSA
ncbi:Hypothetical predicted protein, partial [Podarcis lilfordi]